eukprot:TRINITY_DN16248_c6_g1_i2.p1 TRINITY_DN16248_c6_g1~~TRINITY_DN16248_c6_g1_i2.p1  ORF type:complete len:706 (+),score=168.72 TRINITY_DN16248_c6_g1_i2:56-2173(+)
MPRVFIKEDCESADEFTAKIILKRILDFEKNEEKTKKDFVLMLGGTARVMQVCKVLVEYHKQRLVSFENVAIYLTHEFCDLDEAHPSSIHAVSWEGIFKHIDIKPQNVHTLNGNTADLAAECASFEESMASVGGIDLALVSPDTAGHLGFNEPGSSLVGTTRTKTLSNSTRILYAPSFGGPEHVPVRGLTIGIATILNTRELLTIATSPEACDALSALTYRTVSHRSGFTAFQYHKNSTVIADEAACQEMSKSAYSYYRSLEGNSLHNDDLDTTTLPRLVLTPPCSPGSGVLKVINIKLLRGKDLVSDDLWVRNGRVINPAQRFWEAREVSEYAAETIVDGKGAVCSPGFIDIQLNGAFGIDFTDPALTAESVVTVSKGILSHGCTSYCPTVITSAPEVYRKTLPLLLPQKGGLASGANMLGAHLEGPFLSELKYGAHDKNLVRSPNNGFKDVVNMYGRMDAVALVTLAPELEGSLAAIKDLTARGIKVSLGHSNATLSEAEAGVTAGSNLVTHLFNAMRSFKHRDPGLVGVLGSNLKEKPYYGIIVDGLHTHPASVRIAYRAHPEGCVLVTDAMEAMGMPPGKYKLAGKEVDVVATQLPAAYGGGTANKATLTGTDTLAGAVPTLIDCVRNLIKFTGCSTADALVTATWNPAKALAVHRTKGHLGFGADADFVLLDPTTLDPLATYVDGVRCWEQTCQSAGAKL